MEEVQVSRTNGASYVSPLRRYHYYAYLQRTRMYIVQFQICVHTKSREAAIQPSQASILKTTWV